MRKVGEAAKFLVNRHAKIVAEDIRATNKREAEASAATRAAEAERHTAAANSNAGATDDVGADMDDHKNGDSASTTSDASVDYDNDAATYQQTHPHLRSLLPTENRPTEHVPMRSGGLEEGGSPNPDGLEYEVVNCPEGSEQAVEPSPNVLDGGHADGDVDTGSTLEIAASIDAVDLATTRTARLSRRTSRALHTASAAADAASGAYVSAIVLSDHIDANQPSSTERARRTSNHVDYVRVKSVAIVKDVRAVQTLDACVERNHKALEESIGLHAELDSNIHGDDGYLNGYTRREANDRRSEFSIAVAVAETLLHQATSFINSFIDPSPPDNPLDLLRKFPSQFFAEEAKPRFLHG